MTTTGTSASSPIETARSFFRVANQIRFAVTLSGAAERPIPVTMTGSGNGILYLDGNKLTLDLAYSGLSAVATGAHIHAPASVEEIAGVVVDLQPLHQGAFGAAGKFVGAVNLTPSLVTAILNGMAYVNIHTSNHPAGEIRGQIPRTP